MFTMSGRFFIDSPVITSENKMSVYKLSFDCGMFYIGSSLNMKRRILQYRYNLYNRKDINKKIKAALNSHASAKIEVIESCVDEKTLRDREDFHIKNNWHDIKLLNRSISAYSNRAKKTPEEAFAAGNYMRGRKLTDEQRKLWSDVKKGFIITQDHRDKISKAKIGIPLSEDHKKKLSEAKKGRRMSEEQKAARRGKTNIPVDKFDLSGNFVATYQSYLEAGKSIGCQAGHIGEIVNGVYKSRKGFVFKKHAKEKNNS